MIKIAPSILAADFTNFEKTLKDLEEWKADYVHCDVMDGMFVPNITFGQPMISALRKKTALPLDVHLMIVNPERYIEQFVSAGADIITIHAESTPHVHRALQQIKACNKKAGVVLNPHTPVCAIENVLCDVDMVLLMSVNPGFGGQKLIPKVLDKARELRNLEAKYGYSFDIEMDGGIDENNAKQVIDAGINVLVAGSSVFNSNDPAKTIQVLRG